MAKAYALWRGKILWPYIRKAEAQLGLAPLLLSDQVGVHDDPDFDAPSTSRATRRRCAEVTPAPAPEHPEDPATEYPEEANVGDDLDSEVPEGKHPPREREPEFGEIEVELAVGQFGLHPPGLMPRNVNFDRARVKMLADVRVGRGRCRDIPPFWRRDDVENAESTRKGKEKVIVEGTDGRHGGHQVRSATASLKRELRRKRRAGPVCLYSL